MGILIWYILPAIIVILIVPKILASKPASLYPKFSNPVLIKDLMLSIILALIPLVNMLTLMFAFAFYIIHYDDMLSTTFFNKPLFKKRS